jgi:hypothetical protein
MIYIEPIADGICKLTGKQGTLVRSHIIPLALTPPEVKGDALIQAGRGRPAIRRMTSWYDKELVTAEGEKILMDLDTWAIAELRRHKLIWGSWGQAAELQSPDHVVLPILDAGWGYREIELTDPTRLRLFFLSLLWRAAATGLPEFDQIVIDEPDLSLLRDMVLTGNPNPLHVFSVQLLQLSTRGVPHNLTPYPLMTTEPTPEGGQTPPYPVYRFYFDGLTATFDRRTLTPEFVDERAGIIVGCEQKLHMGTVTFEKSWQRENMKRLMMEQLKAARAKT